MLFVITSDWVLVIRVRNWVGRLRRPLSSILICARPRNFVILTFLSEIKEAHPWASRVEADLKTALAHGFQAFSTFSHLIPLYQDEGLRQDVIMMHECPRCGFSQPIDKYCANCGLDIETYVPKPEGFLVRLGKNTRFQIGLVILVVLLLSGYLYWTQKNELAQRLTEMPLRMNPSVNKTAPASPSANENPQARPSMSETLAKKADSPHGLKPVAETMAQKAAASATATPRELPPQRLNIVFVEASRQTLQQMASEGQLLNETAQTRSFLSSTADDLQSLAGRDADFRVLPGGRGGALRPNTPLSLDFTHLSSGTHEEIGMNLDFTATEINATGVDLTLTGQIHLQGENSTTLINNEINANYTFPPKRTLVLVGFLPHQPVRQEDAGNFSNTPLAIFNSPQFLNGITDFAIFITAK